MLNYQDSSDDNFLSKMNYCVTLFHSETADIRIDIEARFDGDTLIVDGYDTGKKVEEYWGDSDYEYSITIPASGVAKLYTILNVWAGDRQSLLVELQKRYHTNTCFSEIRKLLDDHQVECQGFSWM